MSAAEEQGKKVSLKMMAGVDAQGTKLTQLVGYSSTVVNQVFSENKPIVVSGTEKGRTLASESAVLHNLRSIIAVPLKVRNKVLGVVYLDSHLAKGIFGEEDLELLAAISNHIAIALETSRMAKVELDRVRLQKELEIQSAVAAEAKKVKMLVDNMQQAVFSINSEGTVIEPASLYTENVLGQSIVGKNLMDTMFEGLDLQKADSIRTALLSVFGEDDLQWTLMEDSFPTKIKFYLPALNAQVDSAQKQEVTLKIKTAPIWSGEQRLERVLFVVEDVTAIEQLEMRMLESRRRADMIEDLLEGEAGELKEFLESTLAMITGVLAKAQTKDESAMSKLLRDVHTLKGGARLHHLRQIAEQTHSSESQIADARKASGNQAHVWSVVSAELSKIKQVTSEYHELLLKFYHNQDSGAAGINVAAKAELDAFLSKLSHRLDPEIHKNLRTLLSRLTYKSTSALRLGFTSMARDLSAQLGKAIDLQFEGDVLVDEGIFKVLNECLLHLIRNSMDHGIESAEAREKAGKPKSGTVKIIVEEKGNIVRVTVQDDGRGINGENVLKSALKKGIVSEASAKKLSYDQKVDLIFSEGFSTKEDVSDVSGRGIGMSVVRQNILGAGGTLKLETEVGKGSKFIIELRQNS